MIPSKDERGKAGFEQILSVMPEGWKEKAKELGAFTRGRAIKSAHDLLRLAFLCLAEGKSFGGTAALLGLGDICPISEKAALTRFQKRGEWLGRLCEHLRRKNQATGEAPAWLGGRKACLAGAGGEPARGSGKADRRPRHATGLFDLGMKEMALTGTEQGEKASGFESFGEGDLAAGGRACRGEQGIEYLLGRKSDCPLWFGTRRFHVYNQQGRERAGVFQGVEGGGRGERTLYHEYGGE